jgi:hypothetical protein
MRVDVALAAAPSGPSPDAEITTLPVELDVVMSLVRQLGDGVVNVGHGRDPASIRRAQAFAKEWAAQGGFLGTIVSWPDTAASWLRQATRLATGGDIWVVADTPTGWSGIGPRLADTARWRVDRTIAFPGLDHPSLPVRAGRAVVAGLRGVTTDGRIWTHDGRWLRVTGSGVEEIG